MGGRGVSRIPGWLWDWTCSRWRAGICPSVSRSQGQLRLGVTSMSVRAGGFSSCEPQSLSRLTLTLLRDTLCPASLRGPPPAEGGTCLSFRDRACAVLAVLLLDPPWPRGLSSDPMVLQDLEDPLSGPTAPPPLRVGTRMPPPQWPEHSWSGPRPRALRVPCQASQPWVQRPHSCATSRQKEGALFCLEKADYHR